MPLLPLPDGPLFYTLDGPEAAPVLVLSNSLGTDHTLWDAQVPALSQHFRVLRYDGRGHGQSAVTPGPYSVELLGRDVLALLDGLGIGQAHFCGLSLGGLVGQWLGANAPERLIKLVLSNTAAKIGTAEGWNARIAQVEKEGVGPLTDATASRWFTPKFRQAQPAAVQRILDAFKATPPTGYAACCAAVRDADFWQDVRRIAVPTYVLAGTEDAVTTVADGEFLETHIPRAHMLPLPAAHLANVEAAPMFTGALLRFFMH
ncbi:3-oxoadipate enol-lactonase [Hymenobacter caeli]|uniref:3-oxoadipate enol-lactonase n=1 Tax=Hymenobacter caeli TaxID=2735894 RepID=A0ABX2FWP5_9BACT|nr:3-oxoadipate enol-lactonase [Hymenobacter caeli]NRT20829.1 3-oxoadipate enol-lactonase [Hymenobacter caeli]